MSNRDAAPVWAVFDGFIWHTVYFGQYSQRFLSPCSHLEVTDPDGNVAEVRYHWPTCVVCAVLEYV